jgi:hypothetical protein
MTGGWYVMVALNNFSSDREVLWDIAFVMIKEDGFTINMINSPIRKI